VTPFRPDRAPRGHDPLLGWKMGLFALGAGGGFAGMLFDAGWLITVGAVILTAGVLLRLAGERRRRDDVSAETPDDDDDPAEGATDPPAPGDAAEDPGGDTAGHRYDTDRGRR
jgi:hypothetical protein